MKPTKFYFFIISLSLLLTSCSKEEKEGIVPEPEFPVCKIIAEEAENRKIEARYDALGRLASFDNLQFEYNAQNQLIKRRSSGRDVFGKERETVTTFTWKGQALAEAVREVKTDQLLHRRVYKFTSDTKNRIIAAILVSNNYENNLFVQFDYTFSYDAAGNLIKVTFKNKETGRVYINEYTYDNKKGPNELYRLVYPEEYSYFSKNNELTRKEDGISSVPYTYTYNDKGYATQRKTKNGSFEFVINYTYECK